MSESVQGEYERSMTIDAPAEQIFDFMSEISNLPKYMPTTKRAESQGGERVRVQGEAEGHRYDADGYLRADRDAMRLEWGADEGYYSGYMQVEPQGDSSAQVTVHLSFRDTPAPDDDDSGDAPSPSDIEEGMQKSLESIANQVTGRGGKEEPAAAT